LRLTGQAPPHSDLLEPFQIVVNDKVLRDLRRRLAATRLGARA